MNWHNMPEDLQLTVEQMQRLTLADIEEMFTRAIMKGIEDDYATVFWHNLAFARSTEPSMQTIVNHLEAYKRRLGRQYDKIPANTPVSKAVKTYVAIIYNEVEQNIQYLVQNYDVYRKNRQHVISFR